jgi:hypothetical protein
MVLNSKSFIKGTSLSILLVLGLFSFQKLFGQGKDLPVFNWSRMVLGLQAQGHLSEVRPEFLSSKIFPGVEPAPVLIPDPQNARRFRIFWQQIPIQNGWVSIRRTGNKRGLVVDFPVINFRVLSSFSNPPAHLHWVAEPGGLRPMVYEMEKRGLESWATWKDAEGIMTYEENWQLRSGTDTLIKARVFRPDPVSRLQIPYGGMLRDRQDSSSSLLETALDSVILRLKFKNDTFFLSHPAFRIGEFSPPFKPTPLFLHPDSFLLNRSHPAFEAVNTFFHISRFRSYIDSLGFSNLLTPDLRIDVHGMDGADQSSYDPSEDLLSFGDGNVDDAEDAGVVIHEYGHVLGQAAISFGNSGHERRSIEEGVCDYLAGSYVRTYSDYEPLKLFKWDGHNEFWSGRTLNTPRMYPENLVGQIHKDGEIFAAALMAGEVALGRSVMCRLILSAWPDLMPNSTMPMAARLFLDTDTLLFGGSHSEILKQAFLSKGINPGQVIVSTGNKPASRQNGFVRYSNFPCKGWTVTGLAAARESILLVVFSGRQIARHIAETSSLFISAEGLLPGMYMLHISDASGLRTEKVVVFP